MKNSKTFFIRILLLGLERSRMITKHAENYCVRVNRMLAEMR